MGAWKKCLSGGGLWIEVLPICCPLVPHKPERAKWTAGSIHRERRPPCPTARKQSSPDSLPGHERCSLKGGRPGCAADGVACLRLRPTRRQERRQVGAIDIGAASFHAGKNRSILDGNAGCGNEASIRQCGAPGDQFRYSCRRFDGTATIIGASAVDSARATGRPDVRRTGSNGPEPARRSRAPCKGRLIRAVTAPPRGCRDARWRIPAPAARPPDLRRRG